MTNGKGYFFGTIERPPAAGQIRATWAGADFPLTAESRPVDVPAP